MLNRQLQSQMWMKNVANLNPFHLMSGQVADVGSMRLPISVDNQGSIDNTSKSNNDETALENSNRNTN